MKYVMNLRSRRSKSGHSSTFRATPQNTRVNFCCVTAASIQGGLMPSTPNRAQVQNKLLTALPKDELERLLPNLELIHLKKSEILNVAGDAVEYAYFPNNGIISLLSTTSSGATIEVAMVGQEGMVG